MKDSALGGASIRRVAIASFVGTTIEWYDFFLYGTASALVFNRLFFPNYDPMMGTLASFGVAFITALSVYLASETAHEDIHPETNKKPSEKLRDEESG